LWTSLQVFAQRKGIAKQKLFDPQGRRLDPTAPIAGAAIASLARG
jgi:hypothetical protein